MICKKEHSEIQNIMSKLPVSQGGMGRHKCAACSFEEGYSDGMKGIKRNVDDVIELLPECQAKAQRHKSCEISYEKGFEIGSKVKASIDFAKIAMEGRVSGITFPKGKKLLQLYKLNDTFIVGVFQGSVSKNDMIVKFKQYDSETFTWSRFRQPKHIHWTVDVLIKQEYNKAIINRFLSGLLSDWENRIIIPHLSSAEERTEFLNPEIILRFVLIEAEQYQDYQLRGEYPIPFLLLISRILMVQERTNNENAFMFKGLLESLKEHKDLYTIINKATFNGR